MTIEAWNLFFSAAITALLMIGGLWLKHVVDQQLKAKDSAIQALESALKSKDAEISALKADIAPAITRAYADMRQHANQMTEEAQRLSTQVKQLTAEQGRQTHAEEDSELNKMLTTAIAKAKGLWLASDVVMKALNRRIFIRDELSTSLSREDILDDFLDASGEVINQTRKQIQVAEEIKRTMAAT